MKPLLIDNFNNFETIFEINLQPIANQTFTTTINDNIYSFDIKTFIDDKTQISIYKNGDLIVANADIKINIDLAYLSDIEPNALFFVRKNNENINFNYSDFGDNLALIYGVYSDTLKLDDELNLKYSMVENYKNIMEF